MYDYLLKAKFSGFRVRHCLDSASIDTISVSVSVKKIGLRLYILQTYNIGLMYTRGHCYSGDHDETFGRFGVCLALTETV